MSKEAFTFKFETGVPMPERRAGAGTPKYDWSQFPAPKDPKDPKTYPSTFIPGLKSAKTVHTSIKRYKERLKAEGKKDADMPNFSTFQEKDKSGKLIGFRVFRTK